MYYQIAMEVLIVGDQEEMIQRAVYRGPELALLLNRVLRGLNRRLGINLCNSLDSDNPAEADVTLAVRAWTSYENSLNDDSDLLFSSHLTKLHRGGAPGSGTSSPGLTSEAGTSETPPK